jgi:DNA-binding response OmpR family regulator
MPSPKARILCTEDNTDTRELLIVLLQCADYEVVCTDNAKEAFMLAKSQSFDLYLVDSWLPDSSGLRLTEWIREFDKTTPILFYSGAAYDSDLRNALNAGASGYLVKPADNDKLLSEIDRLIESSKVVRV